MSKLEIEFPIPLDLLGAFYGAPIIDRVVDIEMVDNMVNKDNIEPILSFAEDFLPGDYTAVTEDDNLIGFSEYMSMAKKRIYCAAPISINVPKTEKHLLKLNFFTQLRQDPFLKELAYCYMKDSRSIEDDVQWAINQFVKLFSNRQLLETSNLGYGINYVRLFAYIRFRLQEALGCDQIVLDLHTQRILFGRVKNYAEKIQQYPVTVIKSVYLRNIFCPIVESIIVSCGDIHGVTNESLYLFDN